MARERRRRYSSSSFKEINSLPTEIIGVILSHLECVRDVGNAAMTCREWRAAVKDDLHKITCRFPNLAATDGELEKYERTITAAVKQTRNLRELSVVNGTVSMCSLRAWLLHTKETLKSFNFLPNNRSTTRILQEGFVRGDDFNIPSIVTSDSLPSLVSLTLDGVRESLRTIQDLQLLFSCLFKVESVSLIDIHVETAASRVVLNLSSSLKSLNMTRLFFVRCDRLLNPRSETTLVLHADSLSFLSLISLSTTQLMSVEVEQIKSSWQLSIHEFEIFWLRLGGSLEHLDIWNAPIRNLELESLTSLIDLTLFQERNSRAMWPVYSKIKQKASMNLRKLQLLGGLPTFSVKDLDILAWRYPNLQWLSLYHQDTLLGNSCRKQLPVFGQLIHLELYVNNRVTDHDLVACWILKLLQCCPNLKVLDIRIEPRLSLSWAEEKEFPYKLSPLLKGFMRSYPHVRVRLTEVGSKEELKVFS